VTTETTPSDSRPELDALIAAPTQHRLLLENDRVRVLDTEIAPGERTPLHTHCWPAVHYVISWSDFLRRAPDDSILLDSRSLGQTPASGSAVWGNPLEAHSLENIGSTTLRIVSIEIKQPGQT
jgi:hypothetical protein